MQERDKTDPADDPLMTAFVMGMIAGLLFTLIVGGIIVFISISLQL